MREPRNEEGIRDVSVWWQWWLCDCGWSVVDVVEAADARMTDHLNDYAVRAVMVGGCERSRADAAAALFLEAAKKVPT